MNVIAPRATPPTTPAPKPAAKASTGDFAATLRGEQQPRQVDDDTAPRPGDGGAEEVKSPDAAIGEAASTDAGAPLEEAPGLEGAPADVAAPSPEIAPEIAMVASAEAVALDPPTELPATPEALDVEEAPAEAQTAAAPEAPAEALTAAAPEATAEAQTAAAPEAPVEVAPAVAPVAVEPRGAEARGAERRPAPRGTSAAPGVVEASTPVVVDGQATAEAPTMDAAPSDGMAPRAGAAAPEADDRDWSELADRLHQNLRRSPQAPTPQARSARAAATLAFVAPMEAATTLATTAPAPETPPEAPSAEVAPQNRPVPAAKEAVAPIRDGLPPDGEGAGDGAMDQQPSRDGAAPETAESSPGDAVLRPARAVEAPRPVVAPTVDATAPAKPASPAPAPVVAPEASLAAERQDAAASAVNRMTLRRGADAEVDIPELGRIRVSAQTVGREVDVELSSREAAAVAVLHSTRSQMVSELRTSEIDLRHLEVRRDESAPQDDRAGRDPSTRDGDPSRRGRDGTGPANPGVSRGTPGPAPHAPSPPRNVRVVL